MRIGIDVIDLTELEGRLLVVFDGRCGFCNRSVRWLLRRDRFDRLRFVPFKSPMIADLLRRNGIVGENSALNPSTILVVRDAGLPGQTDLVRSNAVIETLRELPPPWPALATLLRVIPRPLRDYGYMLIARWRFRLGNRLESCPLPTAAERARFL